MRNSDGGPSIGLTEGCGEREAKVNVSTLSPRERGAENNVNRKKGADAHLGLNGLARLAARLDQLDDKDDRKCKTAGI